MKPVCVMCERFYRPKKNGFGWIEGMPIDNDTKPGLAEPEKWEAYKLWNGDLWECPDCGAQIIVGNGSRPVAEHYQPDFEKLIREYEAILLVKDC